jgi:hypothetical protein
MTNKNKINEDMMGAATNKTTVNIKKADLGDTKVTSNIKKLGNDVSVNVVDEDMVPKKTITDRQLSRLAQQAGNFGEDVKDQLFDLMMYGDNIPLDMVKKVLANYDLTLKDLKGQDATFRPSAEFAHLFNSSLKEEDAVIEPQDQATIKYLSNVKDANTGKVSQPFTIADKRYQMIRGIDPSKQVVMAVFCHDDMNDAGENIIHSIEEFEAKVAKPMLEKEGKEMPIEEDGYDFAAAEREYYDKEDFIDYLNLKGLEGFKHFFVNVNTGEIVGKYKTMDQMLASRQEMGNGVVHMTPRKLKSFRFGDYFKNDVNETEDMTDGTDVSKLQADVKKLSKLIKDKFSVALSKLDKPLEQVQFLQAMANEIGIPLNKLSTLMASFKDIAKDGADTTPTLAESKKMTKNQLLESLRSKKVIKTIKAKDIK